MVLITIHLRFAKSVWQEDAPRSNRCREHTAGELDHLPHLTPYCAEDEAVVAYAPSTLAGSTFTPGPIVDEMATRWT